MGEVHALLGENGAGKSTLVKMIYGLVRPGCRADDAARRALCARRSRASARRQGVAMVFQHFSLFEALNVAENVALGMENPPPMGELAARIRAVSEEYGLPLDPGRMVGDLSAGERQRVEIIRCLLQDPKLLIMDEPTSRADAAGGGDPVPDPAAAGGARARRSSTSATSWRKSAACATRRRSCGAGKVVATCIPREKIGARDWPS